MAEIPRFALKEGVREQHRKIARWNMIWISMMQAMINFGIIWGILNSKFDENMIGGVGIGWFMLLSVAGPNVVLALPLLLWYNSNPYRRKVPDKVRKEVSKIYAGGEDDDDTKTAWDKALDEEIGGLPY